MTSFMVLWLNWSCMCQWACLLLFPKRHKQVATATVASPTIHKFEAIATKPEGGVSVWKGPSLSIPQSREEAIPAEFEPLGVNIGDTKWVYCCHVEGCSERPSTS